MLVTDLHHFLDLPEDTPGPARRLADHLGAIVRAATAGAVGTAWQTALPCRRRPAHRPCPGRLIVLRPEPAAPIRWQCSSCDQGVINNWDDPPFDLRPRQLTLAGAVHHLIIPIEVAAALRELQLLDTDCQRLVFAIRAHRDTPRACRPSRLRAAATRRPTKPSVAPRRSGPPGEEGRRRLERLFGPGVGGATRLGVGHPVARPVGSVGRKDARG